MTDATNAQHHSEDLDQRADALLSKVEEACERVERAAGSDAVPTDLGVEALHDAKAAVDALASEVGAVVGATPGPEVVESPAGSRSDPVVAEIAEIADEPDAPLVSVAAVDSSAGVPATISGSALGGQPPETSTPGLGGESEIPAGATASATVVESGVGPEVESHGEPAVTEPPEKAAPSEMASGEGTVDAATVDEVSAEPARLAAEQAPENAQAAIEAPTEAQAPAEAAAQAVLEGQAEPLIDTAAASPPGASPAVEEAVTTAPIVTVPNAVSTSSPNPEATSPHAASPSETLPEELETPAVENAMEGVLEAVAKTEASLEKATGAAVPVLKSTEAGVSKPVVPEKTVTVPQAASLLESQAVPAEDIQSLDADLAALTESLLAADESGSNASSEDAAGIASGPVEAVPVPTPSAVAPTPVAAAASVSPPTPAAVATGAPATPEHLDGVAKTGDASAASPRPDARDGLAAGNAGSASKNVRASAGQRIGTMGRGFLRMMVPVGDALRPIILKVLTLISKPLLSKPKVVRDMIGVVGLWTFSMAGAIWVWALFFYTPPLPAVPKPPTELVGSGKAEGKQGHEEAGGHSNVEPKMVEERSSEPSKARAGAHEVVKAPTAHEPTAHEAANHEPTSHDKGHPEH